MVEAIENGYPQKEIAESAYTYQRGVEAGNRIVVGVNAYVAGAEVPIPLLYIDQSAADTQLARLANVKATRDDTAVRQSLDRLKAGAAGDANTMPLLIDAVRAYATLGEMCDVLREVWGEYEEIPVI
jgi:methylmalonyl-CoA mutase N-terminal domain/subunit